jgi:hypothetical protein
MRIFQSPSLRGLFAWQVNGSGFLLDFSGQSGAGGMNLHCHLGWPRQ